MSEQFTLVEITFYPEFLNHWLRFGIPDLEFDLDRRRSFACFKPGRTFCYVRWIANEYGTQKWQFYVVRTVGQSQLLTRIDGVHPGGEILLKTSGTTKLKQVLSIIDNFEERGFDPDEVSHSYFRHVHNRLSVRQPIQPYTYTQHNAVRATRMVLM